MRPAPTPRPIPDDVVGALTACHDKIRQYTGLAWRLAAELSPEAEHVRTTASEIARYFAAALPRHAADEDQSIAPRLRGFNHEVDRALDRSAEEHAKEAPLIARLIALCEDLAQSPEAHARRATELAQLAAELAGLFEDHLLIEEQVLFPAIAALPHEKLREIRDEMRLRHH